jgi:phosphocarrier protein HPr
MSEAVTANVTVPGPNGLHMVPCSLIVKCVGEFTCQILIRKGNTVANARHILDLLSLGAGEGTVLSCKASGADASAAIQSLVELFSSGFHGHVVRDTDQVE